MQRGGGRRRRQTEVQIPLIVAADVCGVTFQEFENFCNTVLRRMRYCNVGGIILKKYTASCKTAIEEFYSNSNTAAADDAAASTSDGAAAAFSSSPQVSFHLEVALFCIGAVADDAMTSTSPNCSMTKGSP